MVLNLVINIIIIYNYYFKKYLCGGTLILSFIINLPPFMYYLL